jgi:DNA-binding MarR family transcriptional regulator
MTSKDGGLTTSDYQALAEFRYQIRRFLRFSEAAARSAGMEPQQHQLLLAVKGMPNGSRATVGDLAERLQIQHHSTVELVDRMAKQRLVQRRRSESDRRQVMVSLTAKGEKVLLELSIHHREELLSMGPVLVSALRKLMRTLKASESGLAETTPKADPKRPRRSRLPM